MSKRRLHVDDVLVFIILCCSYIISVSEADEISLIVDKHKCDRDARVLSTSPRSTDNQLSTWLNCPNRNISQKYMTIEDFKRSEHGGTLYVSFLSRTLHSNEYCVVEHTGNYFKIAMCLEYPQIKSEPSPSPALGEDHNFDRHLEQYTPSLTIRKCCASFQQINASVHQNGTIKGYKCVLPLNATEETWELPVYNSTSDDYSKHRQLEDFENVTYIYGVPNCSLQGLSNDMDIWFMQLENGRVMIGLKFWFKPVWLPVDDKDFCLDQLVDHDPSSHSPATLTSHHKEQMLLYCKIQHFDDYLFHRRLFGGMCVTAAGIVFILLVIYVSIWDKQNLAGWTQFNIFVAVFFVVLMEGLRTLANVNGLHVESSLTCVIIAAVAQYFFFALNTTWTVMCFDLFYMFWKLESTSKTVARYKNRLICYLIFSWGVPFVVVLTAFYVSHTTATEEMSEMKGIYAFAHRRCSSPIRNLGFQAQGIMFLLNLLFFSLTTALLWKHRRGLNAARKKMRNERHTWRSVTLFVKLVVVMGVASLSIPLDYFFVSSDPLSKTALCFRVVHFIPFVGILFIFGFNDKNMLLVSQKYPHVAKYFGFVACSSGANASDTVNHSRSGNNHIADHPSSPR